MMRAASRRVPRGILAVFLAPVICLLFVAQHAPAEIIFEDDSSQAGESITSSVPAIDVEGQGWQLVPQRAPFYLDGRGHILDAGTNGAVACVPLIPIGPHGTMTLTATVQLPVDPTQWIGMGLANSNTVLIGTGGRSGPWVRIDGGGGIILYGGTGANNPLTVSNAFVNSGAPLEFLLTYNAFAASATVAIVSGAATNMILNSVPITNTLPAITARSLVFQSSAASPPSSNRWIAAVKLDWFPRPPPLLSLPVPPGTIVTNKVGPPTGTNDISIIQKALNFAATNTVPTEVLFNAGATYIITNTNKIADMPLTLSGANNVLINGNGCEVLIKNPRIGFLHLQNSTNVIVENITVDYDPLPYTQGMVTRNLYTHPPIGTAAEPAIEFRLDSGYPAPTNANYVDTNAINSAERWGIVMDTNNPGRGADDRYTIYTYTNVVQTNVSGAFKVQFTGHSFMQTIQSNDFWCMVSRWNGSSVYSAGSCYQLTFLQLTNYAGAAANFEAQYTPLVNEINCVVAIGPPPAGATRGRIKSSNADGGYFGSSRIGPWVQGCNFTGLSDDVANAYTEPLVITNAPATPTNTFSLWNYNNGGRPTALSAAEVELGDQLLFFNAYTGAVFDEAVVLATNATEITVDHSISGIVNGTDETNTMVINNSLNTSAVYLNNQFSNSRIHGIYCRANNILIAHNSVSGMGLSAISGFPALDLGAPNSFVPTNAIIMDNVLSDCSYSYDAINNAIPSQEPAFALIELHQTRDTNDYVTNSFAISGLRILNNAFLNWRRAPLSLHNVTDAIVAGNYFGPPITSDGLVPLSADYMGDLWACDYANITFAENVNATGVSNAAAIHEDGSPVLLSSAFTPLTAPVLSLAVDGANALVNWSSPTPAFVPQQTGKLLGSATAWTDLSGTLSINGTSNAISAARNGGAILQYYRLRQR
jgi:hypothetical protein